MFISPRCNVYFHQSLLWIRIMHFSTCEQRVCQRGSVFAAPTISFVFFWRCSLQVFICDPCLGSCVFLSFFGIQTCSCGPVRATWRYNLQREQSNFWLRIVFLHCLRVFTGKLFVYPMMEFGVFRFQHFIFFLNLVTANAVVVCRLWKRLPCQYLVMVEWGIDCMAEHQTSRNEVYHELNEKTQISVNC